MNPWLRQFLAVVVLTGITSVFPSSGLVFAENRIVTLGTGGVTGLYYPTGGAFCRLANLTRDRHGIRCAVRSTLGSVSNIQRVSDGRLDMGIAEAGQLYDAFHGRGVFDQPETKLRALFNIFPEYITIISRIDSGITSFSDLRYKRINMGLEGSSQRITLDALIKSLGWKTSDFQEIHELEPAEQANALCDNQIDATLYVVGHPSGAIKEALRDCNSRLISLNAAEILALTEQNPHYYSTRLENSYYDTDLSDIDTAGVNATLFTRADLDEEVVYALVKSLFNQFDQFRSLHPAFTELNVKEMVNITQAAPMHPGAERYFREVGLLE